MMDSTLERDVTKQAAQPETDSFQHRVSEWMGDCFLPSLYSNMTERGDRLLEEVLELLQSKNYDRRRIATLVDYVWSRPVGEPVQEVGGVMVTLAGFCWIAGLNMHEAGEDELARINLPEVMDKIRRKQEAKNALHFDTPIPGDADAQPRAMPDEPYYAGDLFWPDDDGEMCANDMCQLVQDMADNDMVKSGDTIRIRRARSLPFSDVIVTIAEDGTADYEAATPQPKESRG